MDFGSKSAELDGDVFANLMKWLGDEPLSDGTNFLAQRRRLIIYFDRKNTDFPEDLADETLMRVARRLSEEGRIDGDPARFCYITARFVFHEWLRRASRVVDGEPELFDRAAVDTREDAEIRERRLDCLEKCVGSLDAISRQIITEYYLGVRREKIENRRELASRLGLTANALMIRASRIRDRLEDCIRKCLDRLN